MTIWHADSPVPVRGFIGQAAWGKTKRAMMASMRRVIWAPDLWDETLQVATLEPETLEPETLEMAPLSAERSPNGREFVRVCARNLAKPPLKAG